MADSQPYVPDPTPEGGARTPHEHAQQRYTWNLRGLSPELRSWASCIYYSLDAFHADLSRVKAPVWMLQELNGIREEFGQALDRIRPLGARDDG